jgi:acetyl-CoA C-acetyltransferase
MMDAYVYDHVRTPRGKGRGDGKLHEITPVQLATQVLMGIRDRNGIDTAGIDDVILGCVTPIGEQGCNIARIAALNADYAESVPGQQLNRFCASGLEAVNLAAALVSSGQAEAEAVVAGGVESMSRLPLFADGGACYTDPAVNWHTWYIPQGIGADLIATQDGLGRDAVDGYALESQRRAQRAWKQRWFARSVLPVRDVLGEIVLDHDEHLRVGVSLADLAKLKPAFAAMGESSGYDAVARYRYPHVETIHHVHTAGNASGIVDGAAAVLVAGPKFGRRAGLKPRARIRAFTSIGSEPAIMLTGPAFCTEKLLAREKMTIGDIDLFEVNEAFAAVVLRYMRHFDLSPDRVNVAGGAIAMGHPLGATGAMLLGIVLDELERRDLNTALITLCAAAGMATTTLIERV